MGDATERQLKGLGDSPGRTNPGRMHAITNMQAGQLRARACVMAGGHFFEVESSLDFLLSRNGLGSWIMDGTGNTAAKRTGSR